MSTSVQLLGTLQVQVDDKPVTLPTRKSGALLAYLALHASQPIPRVRLADYFWPEGRTPRANLRAELARLRSALEDDSRQSRLFVVNRDSITLPADNAEIDVQRIFDLLETCETHPHLSVSSCQACCERTAAAIDLYSAPLLEDFGPFGSAEVETELEIRRTELENRILDALENLEIHLAQAGSHEQVIAYARRHLALRPGLEEPARRLMMAYTLTNRRQEALDVYATLTKELAEYDTGPSASLTGLYEQIRTRPTTSRKLALTSPYPGLSSFGPDDTHNFFGRESTVVRLLEAVSTQPTTLLIGPSGSGKSSVVYAGLVPHLHRMNSDNGAQRTVIAFRPGRAPLTNLAQAIYPSGDATAGAETIEETLRNNGRTLRSIIGEALIPAQPLADGPVQPPLLIVDQFEEIFTLCEDETIGRLLISGLLDSSGPHDEENAGSAPLSVLLVMRADFLGQALEQPAFGVIQPEQMILLGRMNNEQLRRAIEEPARRSGIVFEPGLIERILDDLETAPGQLPLLQFALALLWDARTEHWITNEAYNDIEQVSGALTHYANGVVARLSLMERERVRRILLRLVQPGENTEDTRRLATRSEIGERDWPLVQRLADSRLVVTNRDSIGQETVEVIHEALIQEWGRLREWLNEDRAFHVWQTRARPMLNSWRRVDEDAGALLRGPALAEAEGWLNERGAEMDEGLAEFVRASLAERDKQAEREQQQRRALEEALAESRRMEQRALARALGAQADQLMQRRSDLALLLAVEALERSSTAQDRSDLLMSLDVNPFLEKILHGHDSPVFYLAISADGRTLISCDERNQIRLWSTDTFASRPFVPAAEESTDDVALDRTGRWFATVHGHRVRLWRMDTLAQRTLIPSHSQPVFRLRFSTDGDYLLSIADDGELCLWRTTDGEVQPPSPPLPRAASTQVGPQAHLLATLIDVDRQPGVGIIERSSGETLTPPLLGHREQIHGLSLSPDGSRLATASFDGAVRVWDMNTGEESIPAIPAHTGRALFAAFSTDDRLLATGGTDNMLHLWEGNTGKRVGLRPLQHSNWVRCAVFAADGKRLISGDSDGKIYVWNLARYHALRGHTKRVRTVAVSPDGHTVATASFDGRIGLWETHSHGQPAFLAAQEGRQIMAGDFSPDGRLFAALDNHGELLLWETETWQRRVTGPNLHNEPSVALAFSPDSRFIAQGDLNGLVSLWDTATGALLTPPTQLHRGPASWILTLAFSPDGSQLATGSRVRTIALWSVPDLLPAGPVFDAHDNWVTYLLFAADGQTLISSGADGYVRFWDPDTGEEKEPPLSGHPGQVWQVNFDPQRGEDVLVTLGGDGSVFWWDRTSRTPLAPPLRTGVETESMALSPDGAWVYLGSFDDVAHAWQIESGPWVEQARAKANRALTPEERRGYLGDNGEQSD